mmetsp:Transcript_23800/g.63777  ORF Transcript_23800/g.63777 Transcript_23800/m.63777 type:complete len:83 (-) Transcript_23800:617-865(-)
MLTGRLCRPRYQHSCKLGLPEAETKEREKAVGQDPGTPPCCIAASQMLVDHLCTPATQCIPGAEPIDHHGMVPEKASASLML